MNDNEAGLFDAFNARHLPPEDVARTFVPPPCFEKLCGISHTILVGPRGSGKTTLLKMLQPQALSFWEHRQAATYRDRINYVGVFVPADISWGAQLEALGYGRLHKTAHNILATASFTTHVLRALLEVMVFRLTPSLMPGQISYLKVSADASTETKLVQDLAGLWKLEPRIPSLLAMKQALRLRMMEIRTLANRGSISDPESFSIEIAQLHFLHLHFIEAMGVAIETFNDLVRDQSRRWAILFDELEIAPEWLQDEIIRSTRSVNETVLIKMALSPYSSGAQKLLQSPIAPAPGDDLLQIPLWYAERESGADFCKELWRASTKNLPEIAQNPETALGASYFEPDANGDAGQYGPGSVWAERFASLARRDRSFAHYLAVNEIDPENPGQAPVSLRDRTVRKAAPIVAVREFYRKGDSATGLQRTRKSDALYAGSASVFAITEGNPRWFKALTSGFARHIATKGVPVPPSVQGSEIRMGAERFLAMLATAPCGETSINTRWQMPTLPQILEAIGSYFFERTVLDEFNPEPPLSFRIADDTQPYLLGLLQIALNRGAIVYVPDADADSVLTSLFGKRFRLCYLLAAHYGLPLRLGKETPLEKVLSNRLGARALTTDMFSG